MTSYIYAFENCIMERAFEKDIGKINKILINKKYKSLKNFEKGIVLKKNFCEFKYFSKSPVENIGKIYRF